MTDKSNFTRRMEASSGERDDGGHRRLGCRAKRAVGPSKRELCGGQRAVKGQDGPRGGRADQGRRRRLRNCRRAKGRARRPEGKVDWRKATEIKAKCIETLRQAGAVVDAKAPGDAAAFKGWLRQISQHVAEASTEGGFLGFGGVPVSESEKATLTEISTALRLAA